MCEDLLLEDASAVRSFKEEKANSKVTSTFRWVLCNFNALNLRDDNDQRKISLSFGVNALLPNRFYCFALQIKEIKLWDMFYQ